MIGEIKTSKELGKLGHQKYIYAACIDCGVLRWTTLTKGEIRNPRCTQCAAKECMSRPEVKNKISVANKGHIAWNKGIPHSSGTKLKMSTSHPDNRGEKNGNWKGGVSVDWAKTHKERVRVIQHNSRLKNKVERSSRWKAKYYHDINFKLSCLIKRRLTLALKYNFKTSKALEYLGCSLEDFKLFMETKFSNGMNWTNYGQWHIDHIKPLILFDLSDDNQLRQAAHYTNLQPLWAVDNIRKGAKYNEIQRQ